MTNILIYFWCGVAERGEKFNIFSRPFFTAQYSNAQFSELGDRPVSNLGGDMPSNVGFRCNVTLFQN